MTQTSVTQIRPRVWRHAATGLDIWLPCDKRTYRVVDRDGNAATSRRFRSFTAAANFLATQPTEA